MVWHQNKTRKITNHNGIEVIKISTPIGVKLESDIDIEVPYLKDITKNNKTGIDPDEDFDYRMVSAGEEFTLTLYEFMYLITKDEYNGTLSAHKDGKDFMLIFQLRLMRMGKFIS